MPSFSLLVNTRNRAGQLKGLLDRMPVAELEKYKVELILTDNASTDHTKQTILDFKEKWADKLCIHYVYAAKPGVGRAKNAGIQQASGDILVFIDDDCYLFEDYFDRLTELLEVYPDAGFFAGSMHKFEESDSDMFCRVFEETELIRPRTFIVPGQVVGANMVIKREVVDAAGFFDPLMGPGTPFRVDDIEFVSRGNIKGFGGVLTPELKVYHHHRRSESDPEFKKIFIGNAYGCGGYYLKLMLIGYWKFIPWFIWRRIYKIFRSIRGRSLKWFIRWIEISFWEWIGMFGYAIYLIRNRTYPALVQKDPD